MPHALRHRASVTAQHTCCITTVASSPGQTRKQADCWRHVQAHIARQLHSDHIDWTAYSSAASKSTPLKTKTETFAAISDKNKGGYAKGSAIASTYSPFGTGDAYSDSVAALKKGKPYVHNHADSYQSGYVTAKAKADGGVFKPKGKGRRRRHGRGM